MTISQVEGAAPGAVWVLAFEDHGAWCAHDEVFMSFEDMLEEAMELVTEDPTLKVRALQVILDPGSALRLGMTLAEAIKGEQVGTDLQAAGMPLNPEDEAYDLGLEKAAELVELILSGGEGS